MRIAELTAFHVRIPLTHSIRHASHARSANDTLIVRCRLDDGTEGWGEGLPRPYVTGETIETAFEQLRATDLPSQLGEKFDGLRAVLPICDAFQLARPAAKPQAAIRNPQSEIRNPKSEIRNRRDCFGNAVRCAIELSLLDAVARVEGVPLSAVTHLVPETIAIRQSQQSVRYSGAITPTSFFGELTRAIKLRYYGFHHCKLKVGVPGYDDAVTLRRVRRVVGRGVDIRIDANEAWTCENLEAKLEPLLPFDITAIEQPVPHDQVDGLAELRPRIPIPIMLDESLCGESDARRAVERGTCDLFNIRLSKCGGLLNSLRLAATAHKAGLGYQLGCQVGETGILSAAGRHFASSVAGIRYLEGSYDRFLVAERLTAEDLTFGRGGYAPALTDPGLSVHLDPQAIDRVKVAEEHWSFD